MSYLIQFNSPVQNLWGLEVKYLAWGDNTSEGVYTVLAHILPLGYKLSWMVVLQIRFSKDFGRHFQI